jgi:hypothetical protein
LLSLLDLPGFDITLPAVVALTCVFLLEGLVGVTLALRIEKRLEFLGFKEELKGGSASNE